MEELKPRSEIDNKNKWSINDLYVSEEKFNEKLNNIEKLIEKIIQFKENITKSSESLLKFMDIEEQLDREISTVYIYAKMKLDEDTTNDSSKSLMEDMIKLYSKVIEAAAFGNPEIIAAGYNLIKEYIKENKDLEKYSFYFEQMFRYEKHTLSKEEEELLSKFTSINDAGKTIYYNLCNADIDLGTIEDEEGKEVSLTQSNYTKFLRSENDKLRKSAFQGMYKFYEKHINTISECYKNKVKEEYVYTKMRNYKSSLEKSLYSDSIDLSVYQNLIDTVSNKIEVIHEYFNFKKELFGLYKMHMYDAYLEMKTSNDLTYSYETAKNIIMEALKPLGEEYIKDIEKAFLENWIDVYPNKGKKSGAYSWGTYKTKPYILLNYNETFDAVSTAAHELGHSIHSHYSDKYNNYHEAQYPIFLAEIASTVNEVLLSEYMLNNTENEEEKIYYINNLLESIKSTLVRQTMFAEFEMLIHNKEQEGTPLTDKVLSETYFDLIKKYHGPAFDYEDDTIKYEWARIPHFYTSFYVYKYATGISAAFQIAYDILEGKEGAKEKYLKFLSSGGSDYPLNTLKKCGVDMSSPEPVAKTLEIFEEKLNKLKKLTRKR